MTSSHARARWPWPWRGGAVLVGLVVVGALLGQTGGEDARTDDGALDRITTLLEGGALVAGDAHSVPDAALCDGQRAVGAEAGPARLLQGMIGSTLVSVRIYPFLSAAAAGRAYLQVGRDLEECDGQPRRTALGGPGIVRITERHESAGHLRALYATEFASEESVAAAGLWSPLEMWVHYSAVEDLLVVTYAFNTDPRSDVRGASAFVGEEAHRSARVTAWRVVADRLGVFEISGEALRAATEGFLAGVYPTRQVQAQCPAAGLQQGAMTTCQADVDGHQVSVAVIDALGRGHSDGLVFEQLSVGLTRSAAEAAARARGAQAPQCGLPEWSTVTIPYVVRCGDPTGEYLFTVGVAPSTQRPVLGTLRADSPSSTP